MIRTESEYQATFKRLAQMRHHLEDEERRLIEEGLPSDQTKRLLDPTRSFAVGLEEELGTYERLQRGDVATIGELINLHNLGQALIALRIVCRITQRELASRLKVDESQISRWERHEYHGVSIERASMILDALGVKARTICEEVNLLESA